MQLNCVIVEYSAFGEDSYSYPMAIIYHINFLHLHKFIIDTGMGTVHILDTRVTMYGLTILGTPLLSV